MIRTTFVSLSILFGATFSVAAPVPVERGSAEEKGTVWGFTPKTELPDVLIIGDSISIGYTPFVRTKMAGVANIFRPMEPDGKKAFNCGDTARGLDLLEDWLMDRNWRVIHFNFGLHDLKWLDAKGAYVSPEKGRQVAPLAKYEANLRELVARLKKTGAHLIFGGTTPVPEGTTGRIAGDEKAYNAVARKIMDENGVVYNDFPAVLGSDLADLQLPANVHFNDKGSDRLADAVVKEVQSALKKPWTPGNVDRAYPSSFVLSAPALAEMEKPTAMPAVTVKFPRPLQFIPGMRIQAEVTLESSENPQSLQAQIQSRSGKVSSLMVKGTVGKAMSVDLVIPEKPVLHPVSKNKEDWAEGDLISRVQFYFRLANAATAKVTVRSLKMTAPAKP